MYTPGGLAQATPTFGGLDSRFTHRLSGSYVLYLFFVLLLVIYSFIFYDFILFFVGDFLTLLGFLINY